MSNNQRSMNKNSLNTSDGQQMSNTGLSRLGKLTWSTLGLSALLALSACSGGDNTATDDIAPASEVETTVVEEEPMVDEVVAPTEETAAVVETSDMPTDDVAVVDADATAEPELLAADAGKQLYETQCVACHGTGLLGAPKFGNAADWAPHLVKDIDTLHMHSAKGFNKMPPQASDTVSEAQVYAAVDYMVAAAS